MTVVAIHQPNFFPWLGYFDKIRRADVFVILDSVQQQKTGGTWTNRVRMLVGGEARWVTAPLERSFSGVRSIRDLCFNESTGWRDKMLKTLSANYRRAPCYDEAMGLLEPLVRLAENAVARYNIHAIRAIAAALGLGTANMRLASDIPHCGHGTELLISLTRSMAGDSYLCGGGAQGYQEDAAFQASGVRLVYQSFQHPVYPQAGRQEFVPGLSVVDALMNCGIRGTATLLCR
jgi:hypothetical protein